MSNYAITTIANPTLGTIAAVSTFPNGNLVSPKVDEYVNKYNEFLFKTVDNFLSLGETLLEAKEILTEGEFKVFCERTGLVSSKGTLSKLLTIGQNAPRFRPYVNNLPQTWTTLYTLAKLEPDQFSNIAPKLTAYSTANDIAVLLGISSKNSTSVKVDVSISFVDLDLATTQKVLADIKYLQDQYKFVLKVNDSLKKDIAALENVASSDQQKIAA